MRRSRPVRVAHAEIDHVAPLGARLRLQRVYLGEDIRRQALDAVEFFGHGEIGPSRRQRRDAPLDGFYMGTLYGDKPPRASGGYQRDRDFRRNAAVETRN